MLAQWHSHPRERPELAPDLARSDDLPLGAQLAWRLRVLIASGQLGPGDRLPGVRELASGTGRQRQHGPRGLRPPGGGRPDRLAPRPGHVRLRGRPGVPRARATGSRGRRQRPRQRRRSSRPGPGDLHRQRAGPRKPRRSSKPARARGPRSTSRRTSFPESRATSAWAGASCAGRSPASRPSLPPIPQTPASRGEPTHPLLRPKGHVADMAELEAIRDELMERLKQAREAAERRGRAAAPRPRPAGGDGQRPGRPQVGDGLQAGSRRARLRELGGAAAVGTGRGADELVASQGLVGMSVNRAASGDQARPEAAVGGGTNGPNRRR